MKKIFAIALIVVFVLGMATFAISGRTPVYGDGILSGLLDSLFGEPLVSYNGNAINGDTIVLAIGASDKFRLYRVDFAPISDITGTINIQLGANTEYAIVNALGGSFYGMDIGPLFVDGALGADVIINAPTGSDINYNIHGKTM